MRRPSHACAAHSTKPRSRGATPVDLYKTIFSDDEFTTEHGAEFAVSTKWLERKYLNREPDSTCEGQPASLSAAVDDTRAPSEEIVIEMNNRRVVLTVPSDVVATLTGGARARGAERPRQPLRGQGMHHVERKPAHDERSGVISSPMQAIVTRINVTTGQTVGKGDLLVVLESMKMENYVYAPVNGTVRDIAASPATSVDAGQTLLTIDVEGAVRYDDAHDAHGAHDAEHKGEQA